MRKKFLFFRWLVSVMAGFLFMILASFPTVAAESEVILNQEPQTPVVETEEDAQERMVPAVTITIKEKDKNDFSNHLLWEMFFKNTIDVFVTAEPAEAGNAVKSVEYLVSENGFESIEAITGTWTLLEKDKEENYCFQIQANKKAFIYVRVTDENGNITVINSEGIVVYTDALQDSESISFTKLSKESVQFSVILNGNSIDKLYIGENEIAADNYVISEDGATVSLKAAYLQTLPVGNYKLHVSYKPMGEAFVEKEGNEAPAFTSVDLSISKIEGTVGITNVPDKIYDGQKANIEYDTNNGNGEVLIEYKKQDEDDQAYSAKEPKNAGAYTVRVTIHEDTEGNYTKAVSAPVNYTIGKRPVTIQGTTVERVKIYDGNTNAIIKEKGVLSENYDGELLSFTAGSAVYADKNAATGKTVTFLGFELTGEAKDNYELTGQPANVTADIIPAELRVQAVVKDKQYDGLNTAQIEGAVVLKGIVGNDDVILTNGTPSFSQVRVGDQITVNFTEFTIRGNDAANYQMIQPEVKASIYNKYEAKLNVDYTVDTNDWQNTDFVVTAKEGYVLSLTDTDEGNWTDTLKKSDETKDGQLKFYVRNKSTKAISLVKIEKYKIDKTPVTGTVKLSGKDTKWGKFLDDITFGMYFNTAQKVTVEAKDQLSGVKSIEYYESSEELPLKEVKALKDKVWEELDGNVKVGLKDGKQFVYYIRLTDYAGNISYISTNGAVYDTTDPVISGVKNGSTYKKNQSVEVSDKNLKSVTVNGKTVEDMDEEFTLTGNKNTSYEIKATDKAGNTTIVKVTMEKEDDDTDDDESAEKPDDEEDSEDTEKEERVSPKTGDDSNVLLWLMIMLFGGAGYFITVSKKRENGSF